MDTQDQIFLFQLDINMKKIYLIIIVLFLFAVNHRSIHADTNSGLVQADLSLITKSLIDIRYGNFTGYSLIRNNQKINISGWKSSASNPFSESALAQNEFSIFKNYKCIADIAGIISAISGGYYLFSTLFPSDSYNYTVKLNSGITVISFLSSRLLYSISIPHLFKFVEYNNKYLINGEDAISEIFKQKKSVSSFSKKWLFSISANYNDFTPKAAYKTTEDVVSTNDLPLLKGAETLFGIPGPSPLLSLGVLFQRNLQSFSIGAEVFYNPMKIEKSYDSLLHAYEIC